MKYSILTILGLLCSCASVNTQDDSQSSIVGMWLLTDFAPDQYYFWHLAFLPDGTKCVLSYTFDSREELEVTAYKSTWSISDEVLTSIVDFSSSPSLYPGFEIQERINLLTSDRMDLLLIKPVQSTPVVALHDRIDQEDAERICKAVDEIAAN